MATTFGTSGNDSWIVVKAGTFTLDGLGGVDTLALGTSLRSAYTIKQSGTAILVDSVSGASSALHATLYNMEILTFDSGRDVLDLATYFKPIVTPVTPKVTNLNGTSASDTLSLGSGIVNVDGLSGLDTVVISQSSSYYKISTTATGYSLTSNDGLNVYNLSHVERISFSNEKIALDLSDTGNAAVVAKVLGAVFGSSAVGNATYAGIGLGLLDGGMSYESLMSLALGVVLPGASLTHKAVVDLLYMNVVGVAPSAEQEKLYVDLLDSHAFSVAQLGTIAADTPFNTTKIGLTGQLLETGLHYV